MPDNSSNKRLAKNSALLYLRTIISTVISLYTSRVVLQVLGVEDYGVYNVVAGVVAMLGFLKSSMSGATSRFITFELGKGNSKSVNEVFCSVFNIHMILALGVVIIAEAFGPWFITHKLVIPEHRMNAALWVFQLSLMTAVIEITQVPYNAMIVAHERLDVFAYVEIAHVTLKLAIVYLLLILPGSKLILYAILLVIVAFIIAATYRIYCITHFQESHLHFIWDKERIKPMLIFSGWDLYGNGCVMASNQGTNFILNMFFGVLLNAASGVATMVGGATRSFAMSVIIAFRPQIIKAYAQNNIDQLNKLTLMGVKFTLILYSLILFPLCIEINTILKYWLTTVPEHTAPFCCYLLISGVFVFVGSITAITIHATGNIKALSFISGSLFLANLPLIYVAFKIAAIPELAYIITMSTAVLNMLSNLIIAKMIVKEFCIGETLMLFTKVMLIAIISDIPAYLLHCNMELSIIRLFTITICYVLVMATASFFLLLSKNERNEILMKMKLKR